MVSPCSPNCVLQQLLSAAKKANSQEQLKMSGNKLLSIRESESVKKTELKESLLNLLQFANKNWRESAARPRQRFAVFTGGGVRNLHSKVLMGFLLQLLTLFSCISS